MLKQWKVSCLCLLDLSAAFDTTDHNILLTRLSSWFGIHGTALNWLRSYLPSRCFRVKCNNDFSSSHSWLCGVSQGSVLGTLLFVMYTTPLSTLVSSVSLNHHLYADDTQLYTWQRAEGRELSLGDTTEASMWGGEISASCERHEKVRPRLDTPASL